MCVCVCFFPKKVNALEKPLFLKIMSSFFFFFLTLCMLDNFTCSFVVCGFFLKICFFKKKKKSFRNTIRVSNSLDPDHARHFVGHDLGPNYLQSYQQTTKVATSRENVKDSLLGSRFFLFRVDPTSGGA